MRSFAGSDHVVVAIFGLFHQDGALTEQLKCYEINADLEMVY